MLYRYPFVAMGSGCEILLDMDSTPAFQAAVGTAQRPIRRLEKKYSFFDPASLLSRLNSKAYGGEFELDEETAHLLEMAGDLFRKTGGGYDPTIGSLHGCWDFRAMRLPDPARLEAQREGIGWEKVELSKGGLRLLHPATKIDLGGLVKEYALDASVAALEAIGVRRGLVNLGGDLRVVGRIPPGNRPFRIGVANPRHHHGTSATLALREGAVVTSGDYQRYFFHQGRRYHHLLDPRTGYPMELRYSGVTVHGRSAMEALRECKRIMMNRGKGKGREPESTYVLCDEEGNPVEWKEAPGCTLFSIMGAAGSSRVSHQGAA